MWRIAETMALTPFFRSGGHEGAGHVINIAQLLLGLEVPGVGVDAGGDVGAALAVLIPVVGVDAVDPAGLFADLFGGGYGLFQGPGSLQGGAHGNLVAAADGPGVLHDVLHIVLHFVFLPEWLALLTVCIIPLNE